MRAGWGWVDFANFCEAANITAAITLNERDDPVAVVEYLFGDSSTKGGALRVEDVRPAKISEILGRVAQMISEVFVRAGPPAAVRPPADAAGGWERTHAGPLRRVRGGRLHRGLLLLCTARAG